MSEPTFCRVIRIVSERLTVTVARYGMDWTADEEFASLHPGLWSLPGTSVDSRLRVDMAGDPPKVALTEQSRYILRVEGYPEVPKRVSLLGNLLIPVHRAGGEATFDFDTGNSVGWASLVGEWGEAGPEVVLARFWVAPRKLSADDDFEWLVDDIARSTRALAFDLSGATTLPWIRTAEAASYEYEDLVFLRSVVGDVETATSRINRRPNERTLRHSPWRDVSIAGEVDSREVVRIGGRADSLAVDRTGLSAAMLAPEVASAFRTRAGQQMVPARVPVVERYRDRDTYENRFVRFVLETFARRADAIALQALRRGKDGVASQARDVATRCGRMLRLPFLEGVGRLAVVQSTSQVLLREDAYHRVLRAYLEYLLAADVSWADDELRRLQEIHDVATLYEMWVFIEAVKSVARLTSGAVEQPASGLPAIHVDASGLVVQLKREQASGLSVRHAHGVTALFYNRSYGPTSSQAGDWNSWSLPLRPDVTIVHSVESFRRSVVLDAGYDTLNWPHLGQQ